MNHSLNRRWLYGGMMITLLLLAPVGALLQQGMMPASEVFTDLASSVLGDYIINTTLLVLMVALGSAVIGVPAAWLVAMCRFPLQRQLQWALLLPLAMPAYLVAYVYTDLLDYAGPVQKALRNWFGWHSPSDYYFPEVRTLGGAAIMLALVLFPYVFMLARTAFLEQAGNLVQASRTLGCSPWRSFFRVSLPLARPAIVVGVALVGMETMADFATVNYFAVNTLTTAVYDVWLGYGSISAAARLSCLMLLGVMLLIAVERRGRAQQKLFQRGDNQQSFHPYTLGGWRAWLACGYCVTMLLLAFVLPAAILLNYAIAYLDWSELDKFWQFSGNSLLVAVLVALLSITVALLLQFLARTGVANWPSQIAGFGYALPGTVLAIGVLIPLTWLDYRINDVAQWLEQPLPGLVLSGSMLALLFGYTVRFLAVALGSVESSYKRINPNLDMAAATMGCQSPQILRRIHLPLLRRGLLTGAVIVFMESMKELPAALLLKPIGFETLATYVYQFVSDEALELGALPALVIVAAGLLPVWLLNRSLEQSQ
ncbi:ABC transporter permease [Ferrimonas lipolytica]|uniref:Iron ABC transporter permease n=1 Tax=Ferrimonas lipolytica TaxID=2724191 RepID=A0A6H1UJ85_9GAMM|nr:iron ABC transporter permease [Ferrimonas lipolytica]QIZ77862.1 iron ABC transporter permease [Ferrimonas lipolytica]